MKTPDTELGSTLERIMAALKRADVLKPDERDHPTHYNRAFSAVREALGVDVDAMIRDSSNPRYRT